ncbi:MAG: hypothetical protein IKM02_04695 [Clostridia bacterium]|nr:hypothetical protein [Clostridia bacterium]
MQNGNHSPSIPPCPNNLDRVGVCTEGSYDALESMAHHNGNRKAAAKVSRDTRRCRADHTNFPPPWFKGGKFFCLYIINVFPINPTLSERFGQGGIKNCDTEEVFSCTVIYFLCRIDDELSILRDWVNDVNKKLPWNVKNY